MISRLFATSWGVLDYSTPTAFVDDPPAAATGADDKPKSKKRKPNAASDSAAGAYGYNSGLAKGKAAPGGTGYSGAAVEDVRPLPFHSFRPAPPPPPPGVEPAGLTTSLPWLPPRSAPARRRRSRSSRSATRRSPSCSSRCASSCRTSGAREAARRATTCRTRRR